MNEPSAGRSGSTRPKVHPPGTEGIIDVYE